MAFRAWPKPVDARRCGHHFDPHANRLFETALRSFAQFVHLLGKVFSAKFYFFDQCCAHDGHVNAQAGKAGNVTRTLNPDATCDQNFRVDEARAANDIPQLTAIRIAHVRGYAGAARANAQIDDITHHGGFIDCLW